MYDSCCAPLPICLSILIRRRVPAQKKNKTNRETEVGEEKKKDKDTDGSLPIRDHDLLLKCVRICATYLPTVVFVLLAHDCSRLPRAR